MGVITRSVTSPKAKTAPQAATNGNQVEEVGTVEATIEAPKVEAQLEASANMDIDASVAVSAAGEKRRGSSDKENGKKEKKKKKKKGFFAKVGDLLDGSSSSSSS